MSPTTEHGPMFLKPSKEPRYMVIEQNIATRDPIEMTSLLEPVYLLICTPEYNKSLLQYGTEGNPKVPVKLVLV